MRLSDIVIVLSRPSKAGNVGAVCRAMKNMGISRLRLAAPEFEATGSAFAGSAGEVRDAFTGVLSPAACDTALAGPVPVDPASGDAAPALSEAGLDYGGNLAVIQARAVHARDVWEKAETFKSLAAAVKDCALVIGATRRRGRRRKQVTMTPAETAAFLKDRPGPAAIVFGNERAGLEDEELQLCNFASHIPVSEAFPSLNLSHAVQIYAYELFMALGGASGAREESAGFPRGESPFSPPRALDPVKGQWVPLGQDAIEGIVAEVTRNFGLLGFYKQAGREEQERFFRDILSRAGVTEREGRYFAGLIARAAQLALKAAPKNGV